MFPLKIKNKKMEQEYHKQFIEKNLWHYKPFLLVIGIVYFLFIIPDYMYITGAINLKVIFILRFLFLAETILIIIKSDYFLRYPRIFMTNTIYEIFAFLIFVFIAYIYEPYSFTIHFLGLLIFILLIFFVIPNKLIIKIIESVLFSIMFYIISLTKISPVQVEFAAFIVYNLIILIICSLSIYRIDYLQRINFLINNRLKKISITDSLTGIYNRYKFDLEMERQINLAKRYGSGFSLIMFDIDDFKEINDQFGHKAGDIVLAEIARIVKKEIRKIDVFARIGGEEFVIILPRTVQKDARILAERLRRKVANYNFLEDLKITCSFGAAEYKGDNKDSLMMKVDKFLYMAKNEGKNCVFSESKILAQE